MKRFICYLYEYQEGRRIRNIGFCKVETAEEGCAVSIHGKGWGMNSPRKLALYLFWRENERCLGVYQGELSNISPALNYRLAYTAEDVGSKERYDRVEGIILCGESGPRYAATWTDEAVDIGRLETVGKEIPDRLHLDTEEQRRETESQYEETQMGEEQEETKDQTAPAQQVKFPESEMPKTPEKLLEMPQGTKDQEEVTQESEETIPEGSTGVSDDVTEIYADMGGASDEREAYEEEMLDEGEEPKDEDPEIAEQECQTRSRFQCTKIERQDLARLIRREWQLANNSFLLHGYYNYHHLAFLQEGEKLFLGVPGVYSEKERRAAQAFGFPGFVNYDEEMFSLPETEREEKDDFGYWCRQVHQIRV